MLYWGKVIFPIPSCGNRIEVLEHHSDIFTNVVHVGCFIRQIIAINCDMTLYLPLREVQATQEVGFTLNQKVQ